MSEIQDLSFDILLTSNVGVLYAMLTETRNDLLYEIKDIKQDQLDFSPSITKIETIGTLLFHIYAIEYSWFFEDIYGEPFDDEE